MSGAAIAARIAKAYDQAGVAAGDGVGAVPVTIIRPGAPTGPNWSPVPGAPVTHTFKALPASAAYTRRTGVALGAKERVYSLANHGVTITPLLSDTLNIYDVSWPVIEVLPIDAAGAVLAWMVKVGR